MYKTIRYLGRSHPWKGFSCAEIEEVLGFCFHMHVLNMTICRPTSVPVPKGSTNWPWDACWAGQCPTPVHSTSAPSCKHFSHTSSHFHHQSLAFFFFFCWNSSRFESSKQNHINKIEENQMANIKHWYFVPQKQRNYSIRKLIQTYSKTNRRTWYVDHST